MNCANFKNLYFRNHPFRLSWSWVMGYSTAPFDRNAKWMQRERAAKLPDHQMYDYLKDQVGFTLADKTYDIKKSFENALDLGCGKGSVSKHIEKMSHIDMVEFSPTMLHVATGPKNVKFTKTVVDEEKPLPFDDNHFDIVYSNLSLHWVNNLANCFKEVKRVLKADGVFLFAVFGADTLYELRSALVLAELEREGGFASHLSPFTEVQDIGTLLNNAGFIMTTINSDQITVGYPTMFELMNDLQGMAENNASHNRKPHLHRDTLMAAAAIYQQMYGQDGGIPATFNVIHAIGWKPDPSKPVHVAARGSGQVSMQDIKRLNELMKEHGMEGRIKMMQELSEKEKK